MCNEKKQNFTESGQSFIKKKDCQSEVCKDKNLKKEDTSITIFKKAYASEKKEEKCHVIPQKSDIICITNRKLCKGDFLKRIETIASAYPRAIVLREKDLSEEEYTVLAKKVMHICKKHEVPCILHSFTKVAMKLNAKAIHMPLPLLRSMTEQEKQYFEIIGASCHSLEDAKEAQRLGCTYITAGHIFLTDCKKGLPGRGLSFLQNICENISIPVYAIGGISNENIDAVRQTGAAGACIMSGFMKCNKVAEIM